MASNHGGHITQETPRSTQQRPSQSYANAIVQGFMPKKDQGIVMESIEGLSNDNCIDGLEKLTNVSNIKSISKISGGRVCVFLTDKSLVEQLCKEILKVKEYELSIKPLVEKN